MINDHPGRRGRGAAAFLATVLLALVAALSIVSTAFATPKGAYASFAECPTTTPGVESCIYAKTESGEFVVGKQRVPITNPIVLQGGLLENGLTGALTVVPAIKGNTLTKSPQNVPGGLLDLVNCTEISNFLERVACELVFENKTTGVTATTELAAPASSIELNEGNLLEGTGTALSLPVKVHLENTFLGSSCYIGSNSHPIVIPFTTGTTSPPAPNKPIKGSPGTFEFSEGGTILTISKNSLVNNSFAAPEATGCGGVFAFLIDPIVDGKLGIPAAAGHNTAVLNGTLKTAAAEAVKGSE
jgi:hypothetical protein